MTSSGGEMACESFEPDNKGIGGGSAAGKYSAILAILKSKLTRNGCLNHL